MNVSELARTLGCELDASARPDLDIAGVAALQDARTGDLTFVSDAKFAAKLEQTEASAAIVTPAMTVPDRVV
ncbi:MAG: LpxD N-terminal domain-containing protein, partial [Cyanobacteria bacterium J06648_11]